MYIAFGSQKITLRASDTLDAARTVAGYLGVQIPDISLDSAGMAALTKNVTMQETANGMNIRLNDPMISGTVQLTDAATEAMLVPTSAILQQEESCYVLVCEGAN